MTSISDFLDAHAHEPALTVQLLEMARTGLAEHQERLRTLFEESVPHPGASDEFFRVVKTGAHKLANISAALCREDLTRLANELESAARAEEEDACREAWSRLNPEIGRLRRAVESAGADSAGEQSAGADSAEEQPSSEDSSQKPPV